MTVQLLELLAGRRVRVGGVVDEQVDLGDLFGQDRQHLGLVAQTEVPAAPEPRGTAHPVERPRGRVQEPRIVPSRICFRVGWLGRSMEWRVPVRFNASAFSRYADETPEETPNSTTCDGRRCRTSAWSSNGASIST